MCTYVHVFAYIYHLPIYWDVWTKWWVSISKTDQITFCMAMDRRANSNNKQLHTFVCTGVCVCTHSCIHTHIHTCTRYKFLFFVSARQSNNSNPFQRYCKRLERNNQEYETHICAHIYVHFVCECDLTYTRVGSACAPITATVGYCQYYFNLSTYVCIYSSFHWNLSLFFLLLPSQLSCFGLKIKRLIVLLFFFFKNINKQKLCIHIRIYN